MYWGSAAITGIECSISRRARGTARDTVRVKARVRVRVNYTE